MIFALQELNSIEMLSYCLNLSITDPSRTDQQLRIYTSRYYYLIEKNQWKPDGLIVMDH